MDLSERICLNCKYFNDLHYVVDKGECRKSPPITGNDGEYNMFPVITVSAWCGEHIIHPSLLK